MEGVQRTVIGETTVLGVVGQGLDRRATREAWMTCNPDHHKQTGFGATPGLEVGQGLDGVGDHSHRVGGVMRAERLHHLSNVLELQTTDSRNHNSTWYTRKRKYVKPFSRSSSARGMPSPAQ